ncbi:MAG: hypothetical protein QNJ73_07680 [Gammaproteobacteria bacterium]|nr:hypothetical protein [Gammaproteobacteria bacterium]
MIGSIAFFWLGILASVALYAGASIYGFDYYEPNWGRGISLQVSFWIAGVLATIGAIGFALGGYLFRAAPTKPSAFVAGVMVAVALFLVTRFQDQVVSTTGGRQLLAASVIWVLSLMAAIPFRSGRDASV